MTAAAKQRSNDDWVADLSGERASAALSDLRQILMRGLRASIGSTADNQREDFVQEALVRIAANLNSFRGDSRFETWAMALAIRVALSELRRARWKDVSLDEMVQAGRLFPVTAPTNHEANQLMSAMNEAIQKDLTPKQREAVLAELGGAPPDEIARRLGTNRNALYKLVYDARIRLKETILQHGWTVADIHRILGDR